MLSEMSDGDERAMLWRKLNFDRAQGGGTSVAQSVMSQPRILREAVHTPPRAPNTRRLAFCPSLRARRALPQLAAMSMFQRDPTAGVFLGGDRVSGQEIRDQNGLCRFPVAFANLRTVFLVIAAQSIANIVKSSLGPLGLDKMLVDNIGVFHHLC